MRVHKAHLALIRLVLILVLPFVRTIRESRLPLNRTTLTRVCFQNSSTSSLTPDFWLKNLGEVKRQNTEERSTSMFNGHERHHHQRTKTLVLWRVAPPSTAGTLPGTRFGHHPSALLTQKRYRTAKKMRFSLVHLP